MAKDTSGKVAAGNEAARKIVRGTSLDGLFDEWEQTYPPGAREGFHRDGIVSEDEFARQLDRLLFVMLEPNSRSGNYDQFYGWDLRYTIPVKVPRKENSKNLARWAGLLLDGVDEVGKPSVEETRSLLGRIAFLNLKKLGGTGTADVVSISVQAWHDREFIQREVRAIRPTIVVTCGEETNRLFGKVLHDDRLWAAPREPIWCWQDIRVLAGNHPSLRPRNAASAFNRLRDRACAAKLGAFGRGGAA